MLLERMDDLMETMDRQGWAATPGYLAHFDSCGLRDECRSAWEKGGFHRAGVGRGVGLGVREEIRSDQVMWLDPATDSAGQTDYLTQLETVRLAFNQRFFLGLFDFECHFAVYPEGAFYAAHLDRHTGTSERIVTVILYLNEDWQPGDGGELKLWTDSGERTGAFTLIEPRMGTMVCFMSGEYWHEVLPAGKPRLSITGWFRQR